MCPICEGYKKYKIFIVTAVYAGEGGSKDRTGQIPMAECQGCNIWRRVDESFLKES